MKKIDRYLLKELFLPIVFGVSLFTFIFMIDIINAVSQILIVKSVSMMEVLILFSYLTPQIMTQTVPMGIFFGIMMTYNSMSSTSEMVAFQSSGLSLNRLIKTPVVLGVLTTILLYLMQEYTMPLAQEKADKLMAKIAYSKPTTQFKEKQFVADSGGGNLYIEKLENENVLKGLIMFAPDETSVFPKILMAQKGTVETDGIVLDNVNTYIIMGTNQEKVDMKTGEVKVDLEKVDVIVGKTQKMDIPKSKFMGDFMNSQKTAMAMSVKTLLQKIKEAKEIGENYRLFENALYQKLYIPLSAIILATLAPLLSIKHSRTIKGLSLGISLAIIFLYMGSLNGILAFLERGVGSPAVLLVIPNVVLLVSTIIFYVIKSRR